MLNRGFTMVELLVAFGIFIMFFTGLFSLFNMGTSMFHSGSWKLNKQKEAQRFFTALKERMEQAANLSRINPAGVGNSQIEIASLSVYTIPTGTTISVATLPAPLKILAFSITKPDMTAAGGNRGLCFPHVIVAQRGSLLFYGSNITGDATVTTAIAAFPPDPTTRLPSGNWTGLPSDFQLGGRVFDLSLTEVKAARVNWGTASGTGVQDAGKVWTLEVDFEEGKYKKTSMTHSIRARVSYDVAVETPAGGL